MKLSSPVLLRSFSTVCIVLLVQLFTHNFAYADDWPQWLGENRDSVWREDGIIEKFPVGGPKLRWKVPIDGGYSSPAIANGKVFVSDWIAEQIEGKPKNLNKGEIPRNHNFVRELRPGHERVLCFRESDGKKLWEHKYRADYTSAPTYAIGPRCIPTVDGESVFTLGAEGDLFCLNVANGKTIWSKSFVDDYQLEIPEWGIAAHPLIDGNKLICVVGGKGTACIAFDKKTGKEIWRSLDSEKPGYCAPMIYEIAGKRQLIIWHDKSINALDPETGKLFWSVPFESTFAMSIGIPKLSGNRIFAMSFARKSAAIDVANDGLSAKVAWTGNARKGIGGVMNMPIIKDDHIYACGNGGNYICAKLSDGTHVWNTFKAASAERPIHWGNVFTIPHKDRYFLANDKGELIIAKLSPKGYDEISRAKLIEPTHQVGSRTLVWSHPSFANRSIYLRNDKELICYSLAKSDHGTDSKSDGEDQAKGSTVHLSAKQLVPRNSILSFDLPQQFVDFRKPLALLDPKTRKAFTSVQIDQKKGIFVLPTDLKAGESMNFVLAIGDFDLPTRKVSIESDGVNATAKVGDKKVFQYAVETRESPKGLDKVYRRSGYIHPVFDPAGNEVTGDFSPDHAHQHGLFFAWVNTTFRDHKVDFWNQKSRTGKVEHNKILNQESGKVFGTLTVSQTHSDITDPEKPVAVINETWTVKIYNVSDPFVFDLRVDHKMLTDEPLKINKYHYGGLGIRGRNNWLVAKSSPRFDKAASFLTSENKGRTGNHTRPNWTSIYGEVDQGNSSLTVFGHPSNFRFPQHVRLHPTMPYFCLAPMVEESFELSKNETYTSHYRIVVANQKPELDFGEKFWKAYSSPAKVEIR